MIFFSIFAELGLEGEGEGEGRGQGKTFFVKADVKSMNCMLNFVLDSVGIVALSFELFKLMKSMMKKQCRICYIIIILVFSHLGTDDFAYLRVNLFHGISPPNFLTECFE